MLKWLALFSMLYMFAAGAAASDKPNIVSAVFAGGCFWCMEPPFDKLDGVISTTSGYTGGAASDARYKQVSSGRTEHIEAVKIEYDPSVISYEKLLTVFWHNVDPFNDRGQFCDRGAHYRSAIFVNNEAEQTAAELSIKELEKKYQFTQSIVTEILPAMPFYAAEEYHQDYYLKNPIRYKYYRTGCGRDRRLFQIWGLTEKAD